MKKQIYLLFLAIFATLPLVLTSCGDDNDDPAASNPLIGTWVGTLADDDNSADTEIVTMTFTADGKMTASGVDSSDAEWVWSFSGNYKVSEEGLSDGVHYKISLSGYFDGDDEFYDDDVDWRIFTVSGNRLDIFFDGSDYTLYRQ